MTDPLPDDRLRETIRELGVAKVARAASVAPTTLYSFVRGDNLHLRSDIRHSVIKAIGELTGNKLDDDHLESVVYAWGSLSESQRKVVADMVQSLTNAEK